MSKKPAFKTRLNNRINEAKKELDLEKKYTDNIETKQTTVILEASLLYAAKEVALKRKRAGIKPNTITGMIRDALREIVHKELNT